MSATNTGRTNLIELDIPPEGLPIALKPYTVPLKYREFVDHEIEQLEEARIISRCMSNWAIPILVVPKKEGCIDSNTSTSTNKIIKSISDYALITRNSTAKSLQHIRSNQMVA